MINYKFNEGQLIDEFKKYVDSTYPVITLKTVTFKPPSSFSIADMV